MNLKNYINSRILADATGIEEAISSGANNTKEITLDSVEAWLDKIGMKNISVAVKKTEPGEYFVTKSSIIADETVMYAMANKSVGMEIVFDTHTKKVKEISLFNQKTGKTLASVVNGAPIEYLDIMDKFEKTFKKK